MGSFAPAGVLGRLAPADFLERYWQKRPLLIRGALRGFRDPLDAHELAGLACEPEVESRLVIERGGRRPWEVVEGPQDARRLRRLPRTHWTLLVQEADRHVPALAELLERFDFVPRWRLDDVMVSFAPRHGSVGPHVDSYDVFLVQGAGRRRWQVDARATPEFLPGLDLRILRRFRPRREWVLEPGDMLYLPPDLAHCGTSLEDAFTYSIGFRAPGSGELTGAFGAHLRERAREHMHYRDPPLRPPDDAGELDRAALAQLRRLLDLALREALSPDEWARFAGRLLTQPKGLEPRPRARRLSADDVGRRLRDGAALEISPRSRALFVRGDAGRDELFVDGRRFPLGRGLAGVAPLLTRSRVVDTDALRRRLRSRRLCALLAELVNLGAYELGLRPRARRRTRAAAGTR